MRFQNELFIAATGTWLPELVAVQPAIDAGLVSEPHRNLGFETVAVAKGTTPPAMAIEAARLAVRRSGIPQPEFGLHLHGSLWFQGLDMWSSASYIANESVGAQAFTFDIGQRSNAGLGALHLAAGYLSAGMASTALVTTADVFDEPGIDRWNDQLYTHFGDAGTAVVLSTSTGLARVVSSAAVQDNWLEGWGRGNSAFTNVPGRELPVPVPRRVAEQAAKQDMEGSWSRMEAAMLKARDEALADAGVGTDDITRAVVPFIHRGGGQHENYDVLGFTEKRSLWEFGRTVGHLGAGDQFAGLNFLLENQLVGHGDLVMLFGVGIGFSFTATVIQILEQPEW